MFAMSTRTVRLDEESEQALEEVRQQTGRSVSAALKQGLEKHCPGVIVQFSTGGRSGAGA